MTGALSSWLDAYGRDHRTRGNELCHFVGVPLVTLSVVGAAARYSWKACAAMFVAGWVFQLVGHYVFEKKAPSFTRDPRFLLIGPVWVVVRLLGR